jgi:hypothetical protein
MEKLTQEILNGASDWIKRKKFRKKLPIVILTNSKLFLLFKDGTKVVIKK